MCSCFIYCCYNISIFSHCCYFASSHHFSLIRHLFARGCCVWAETHRAHTFILCDLFACSFRWHWQHTRIEYRLLPPYSPHPHASFAGAKFPPNTLEFFDLSIIRWSSLSTVNGWNSNSHAECVNPIVHRNTNKYAFAPTHAHTNKFFRLFDKCSGLFHFLCWNDAKKIQNNFVFRGKFVVFHQFDTLVTTHACSHINFCMFELQTQNPFILYPLFFLNGPSISHSKQVH